MTTKQKIINAIENQRLSLLKEGMKSWYNYNLHITFLEWSLNLRDGYKIDIYDTDGFHLDTIVYPE